FETPTVAGLASRVTGAATARAAVRPMPRPARVPLSFAQRRLWFLNRFEPNAGLYNVPLAVRLRGALDLPALRAAMGDVGSRHESRRTLFPDQGGVPYQRILDTAQVPVDVRDIDPADVEDAKLAAQRAGFDLATEIPVRATVFRLGPAEQVLVVVVH